ncbi:hypothetical protein [Pedobacter aquae]|nr:hypothetical protein [Pedobacter aquae]
MPKYPDSLEGWKDWKDCLNVVIGWKVESKKWKEPPPAPPLRGGYLACGL